MAVEIAASRASNLGINWVHSMAAQMADWLAGRMVVLRVDPGAG